MKREPKQTGETYYSVQEVADRFSVSASSVRNWIKSGKLEAVRVGRIIRIEEAAIARMLAASDGAGNE